MKQKRFLLFLVLTFGSFFIPPLSADVVEPFLVQGPFVPVIPSVVTSTSSRFASSPLTGDVVATDARTIMVDNGDVLFTAYVTGITRIDFDMGVNLTTTNLPGSTFIDSKISLLGIDAASSFTFDFIAKLYDGSTVTDIDDLLITPNNGSLLFLPDEGGLFHTTLTPVPSTTTDITFSSQASSPLKSVQFRTIVPENETDKLKLTGSRRLTDIIPVPEPRGIIFVATMGLLIARRRYRNVG